MTDQLPTWLVIAISVYGVGAALFYATVGAVIYIDQEYGIPAFREWFATKMWRSVLLWPLRFYRVADVCFACTLLPILYKLKLTRHRKPYRTLYQKR